MLWIRKNLPTIFMLFFIAGVRSTLANNYFVPSGSMEPTIAIGDRLFVNRVAYDLKFPFTNKILKHIADPKRGDVVVFDSPIKPGLTLVKRLVALPGDHVLFKNGFIYLNGKRLDDFNGSTSYEEHLDGHTYHVQRMPWQFRPEEKEFVVPADHFLMFGDNRDNSADSRVFGFVKRDLLIGKAERVMFSFDLPAVRFERMGKKLD